MFRIPITIIYSLFSLISFCQDPTFESIDPIRIGLSFSLDHVDRDVSREGSVTVAGGLYDDRGSRSHRIGYSAGADVLIPISPRLSFLTGVRYADRGFSSRVFIPALDSLPQEPPPDGPDVTGTEITHGYHFQYLDVPMVLRLQFGDRRARPVISAGLHASYLIGVYRVAYNEMPDGPNETQRVEDDHSFNQINIFPTIGLGLIHLSTDRIWTRLDLAGYYGALAVTGLPERGNLWNAGIMMGVFYSFRAP